MLVEAGGEGGRVCGAAALTTTGPDALGGQCRASQSELEQTSGRAEAVGVCL